MKIKVDQRKSDDNGLDKIEEEKSDDSADVGIDGSFTGTIPEAHRKSSLSAVSVTQMRRDQTNLSDDLSPTDMPWVDKIKPRLAPDWTEIFKE